MRNFMFGIFSNKKSILESGFFKGFCDYHSHILPRVDDGIRSVERALDVIAYYNELGIKKVFFTPHIMQDLEKNNADFLRSEFAKFKEIYKGKMDLNLAAEHMLDSAFPNHLNGGDVLTLWDNYILVETSYMSGPANLEDLFKHINSCGYHIIFAHPERYIYLNKKELLELKTKYNLLFQLNILSLSDYYGKDVKKTALYLLENNLYDMAGTDLHSLGSFSQWVRSIKLSPKHLSALMKIKSGVK